MSKISLLTAHTPPLAADDLIPAVDTSTTITKSIRADQSLLYSKVTILTAAVLTLNGTPVELVAAPGSGKIIIPVQLILFLDWNSAAYDTNTTLQLIYDTGTASSFVAGNVLTATADAIRTNDISHLTNTMITNKKLSLMVETGNPGTGDSPLFVYTYYQILTL